MHDCLAPIRVGKVATNIDQGPIVARIESHVLAGPPNNMKKIVLLASLDHGERTPSAFQDRVLQEYPLLLIMIRECKEEVHFLRQVIAREEAVSTRA